MKAGRVLPALALAFLAGLWGLCFALSPRGEAAAIEVLTPGPEDSESAPLLQPGKTTNSRVSFKNSGLAGCRLRVRVCGPMVDGEPVLEAGHLSPEGFVVSGSADIGGEEYWEQRGAYLYYKNSRTDDLLPPGRETPPLYTAVRLNARIDSEALSALRDISPRQQLYVLAQAQPQGEGPWQEAVPPA